MSFWRFLFDSLRFHARSNLAVALGVVAATAVLTGALVVGDSVKGSLLGLAFERLGRIDDVLVTRYFFRQELAQELAATNGFQEDFALAVPAIVLEASLSEPQSRRQASRVNCLGVTPEFWRLGAGAPVEMPAGDGIVLNRPLAERLQVAVGDDVILRLPLFGDIPADSALGRKSDTVRNRSLRVAAIIEPRGLGEFALRPNQQTPLNAYVPLATLQRAVEEPQQVNAIFVAGKASAEPTIAAPSAEADERLQAALKPQLSDYGLRVEKTPRGYWQLVGDHMLLEPDVEQAALQAFGQDHPQPVLTYLANSLATADGREIPYSTITALDPAPESLLGPLLGVDGKPIERIGDGEILLNRWAADDLEAKPGDEITVKYFLPESTHGKAVETDVRLKLAGIVELTGAADDPELTPPLKGVTDQLSIADWDPPFPFDAARIRSADEEYWDKHKATPKAFVSLATGRKLWSSRFGDATSIRFVPRDPDVSAEALSGRLELPPAELGFAFRPVKRLALAASSGTTGFSGLFLGFSFFLILAALMLVLLLFRLAIDQRASQIGLLGALGWPAKKVRRVLAGEGLLVALAGASVGALVGIGYAWLMLVGLRTWWVAAISTPFVHLEVRPASILIGLVSGALASFAAICWALWRMRKVEVRSLLAGEASPPATIAVDARGSDGGSFFSKRANPPWWQLAVIAAVALAALGGFLSGEAQAGAFFGSGALVLAGMLIGVGRRVRQPRTSTAAMLSAAPLAQLAARNAGRNPLRSTLTIGLVAAAAFLLVAISAFRLSLPDAQLRDSGTGGFALIAESDQPIYEDLEPLAQRLSKPNEPATIHSLRLKPGDDASCLNLYQASQPRLLGVPQTLIDRGGFAWGSTASDDEATSSNPWKLLDQKLGKTPDGRQLIPMAVDANTATYSLHLSGVGGVYELPDGRGGSIPLKVVGLLKNSVLQGSLIVSEASLLEAFPEVSGYRQFLVDAPGRNAAALTQELDKSLSDYGFAAASTVKRLEEYMVVQNTYLETFQSLGGLGLLLGTLGIAAVQLRNVFERRGELALLRAVGFARRRLAAVVLLENVWLVLGGLGLGTLAALVAIAPHLWGDSAAIPWRSLIVMLGLVLLAGMLSGLWAVRAMLRAPLVGALRGD